MLSFWGWKCCFPGDKVQEWFFFKQTVANKVCCEGKWGKKLECVPSTTRKHEKVKWAFSKCYFPGYSGEFLTDFALEIRKMLNFSVQMELNSWKPQDLLVYDIRYSDWVPNSNIIQRKCSFMGYLNKNETCYLSRNDKMN